MIKRGVFILCAFLILAVAMPLLAQGFSPLAIPPNLQVLTSDNANQIGLLVSVEQNAKRISVSPDSTMLAIASQDGDFDYVIDIYDIETGEPIGFIQGRMDFFRDLVWSPNSERVAVISGRTTGGGVEEQSVKVYTIEASADSGRYRLGFSDLWHTN